MPYKDKEVNKIKKRERNRKAYLKDKQRWANKSYQWRQNHPEYMLIKAAEARAKRDGIDFTLTRDNCPIIPDMCPICNIPLFTRKDRKKGPCSNSPTLDRINSSKGYTPENVRIISHRANRLKSDMSIEELEKLLLYMKGLI